MKNTTLAGIIETMQKVQASVHQRSSGLATILAYAAAALITVMAVSQLFAYESMATALAVLLPDGLTRSASVVTALIVILEVFALPYLLPVAVSRLAWLCALVMSWLVPLVWLAIMFVALGAGETALAVPVFGAKLDLDLGIVPVCLMLGLLSVIATITTIDHRQRRG